MAVFEGVRKGLLGVLCNVDREILSLPGLVSCYESE